MLSRRNRKIKIPEGSRRKSETSLNNLIFVPSINDMAETERAYIAGIVDGEGYIGITPRGRNNAIRPCVSISMSNEFFVKGISEIIGVSYREEKSFRKVQKNRVFKINIGNQTDMLYFVQQIEPYLILKKQHAVLLISYLKYRLEKLYTVNNMKKANFGETEHTMMAQMYTLNKNNYCAFNTEEVEEK